MILKQLSLVFFLLILHTKTTSPKMTFPVSFTIVRNINNPLSPSLFLSKTGYSQIDSCNLISLDGFYHSTTSESLKSQVSPLAFWNDAFLRISAQKSSQAGNSDIEVQKYLLEKYHQKGIKVLFNALSNQDPVSELNVSASTVANNIISVLSSTNLDGVSIQFEDYHAVLTRKASPWLKSLLQILSLNLKDKIIVLILPSTFPANMDLFKSPLINSYVDLFVLKYFDFQQSDYKDYNSLFQNASIYKGTSLFQILKNKEIIIDICRTVIAKPSTNEVIRAFNFFIDSSLLNSYFMQANKKIGWFSGYANLDFESDSDLQYQKDCLKGLRNVCRQKNNCYC